MKRRFLPILSTLSLLLLAAIIFLWLRSHLLSDHIRDRAWPGPWSVNIRIQSGQGAIGCQIFARYDPRSPDERQAILARYPPLLDIHHRKPFAQPPNFGLIERGHYYRFGPFRLATFGHDTVFGPGIELITPYWTLALAAAFLPAAYWHHRRRQRRRSKSNLCPTCNYDLRATPDRCPECGFAPAKARA